MSHEHYEGLEKYRRNGINANDRRRWRANFLPGGRWYSVKEYGSPTHAIIEPCARVLDHSEKTEDGLTCYQVAYMLANNAVPPSDMSISHQCRNPVSAAVTNCCNPTHMFLQSRGDNRGNAKCHNAIVKSANKLIARHRMLGLGAVVGPIKSPLENCAFKDRGCCFINYGRNPAVVNASQCRYIPR